MCLDTTAEYINAGWCIVNDLRKEYCRKCGALLRADEIAMTKKLINRGTTIYYCTDCLAETFDVKREDIEEKIVYYKRMGCTLFQ